MDNVPSASGTRNGPVAPAVTKISPTSGFTTGSTIVTVAGKSFTSSSTVDFGNTPALSVTFGSAKKLTATSPPESAGTVDVRVLTGAQESAAVSHDRFTYKPPATPSIKKIKPTMGPTSGSTMITITGKNFTSSSTVDFGSTAALRVTYSSATKLSATSPPGSQGKVDLRVLNGSQESAIVKHDKFSYTGPMSCTDNWTGTSDNSWAIAGNWSKGHVPTSADWACIPLHAANLPVQLTSSATINTITNIGGLDISGGSLTIGSTSSTSTGSLDLSNAYLSGPGTLTIPNGGNVTMTACPDGLESGIKLVNDGTLTDTTGCVVYLYDSSVLENAGTLVLGNGAEIVDESGTPQIINNTSGTIERAFVY